MPPSCIQLSGCKDGNRAVSSAREGLLSFAVYALCEITFPGLRRWLHLILNRAGIDSGHPYSQNKSTPRHTHHDPQPRTSLRWLPMHFGISYRERDCHQISSTKFSIGTRCAPRLTCSGTLYDPSSGRTGTSPHRHGHRARCGDVPVDQTEGFQCLVELSHESLRDSIGLANYSDEVKERFYYMIGGGINAALLHTTKWM